MANGKPRIVKYEPPSPLRYPGGKYLLTTYVSCVLEENFLTGCTFYEAYAGGCSISIELLNRGFISKAVWIERDPLIYAFWHSVFNATDELCATIMRTPISMRTWKNLLPARAVDRPNKSKLSLPALGFAGLFFNRTNFSGIIGAGPIGGMKQTSEYKIGCRFNREKIVSQIKEIAKYRDRVHIKFGDAISFLRKNSQKISTDFSFTYIDPPYYAQGKKLYRYFYEDSDHEALARYICAQGYPWLISYDDHPRIRELYSTEDMQPIYLDYQAKSRRKGRELVISNLVIPPPIYETAAYPLPLETATA